MITNSTKGVFALEDAYKKIASGCWVYDGNNDPGVSTLWSWGYNSYGQLGIGLSGPGHYAKSSPIQIPGTSWNDISVGYVATGATKTDGTLWTWGNGAGGRLGDGTTICRSSPVQVPGTSWNDIASGRISAAARKTDGTLWTWGSNFVGQLGQGDRIYRSSPVQVPGTSWSDIASSGASHFLARKTDGTLWAWGRNYEGQLGQGDRIYACSPVQIPGTSWNDISASLEHSTARKTDGTLWAWGRDSEGQLGDNTPGLYANRKSSPVQVPGTSWCCVSASNKNTMAKKTDGTLWSWGDGFYVGDNTTIHRSSPVQIPGTSWKDISTGRASMATKTDQTLWVWGNGNGNGLGQIISCPRASSPVQIPGTSWNKICASCNRTNMATKCTSS